ncbi:trypsin-like peptidase domain-containing protein [Roseobacter sp. EG26]
MFYLPPQELWYLTVARLSVTYDDGRKGVGTGFFIYDRTHYFLVTARHVVDPQYVPKAAINQAICKEIDVSFQSSVNSGTPKAAIGYQRFCIGDPEFAHDDMEVDVAAIKIPANVLPINSGENLIRPWSFGLDFLATDEDLSSRHAGEPVVFVGFPDNSPVNRVGTSEFNYPLLRQGVFAYPPIHGIDVYGELGSNYGLIDSYAQSGFSGGPVISLQKGWGDGSWHPKRDHRPSKVVGLICGHYRSAQDRADGGHAGLSFFARSSSIQSVIQQLKDRSD